MSSEQLYSATERKHGLHEQTFLTYLITKYRFHSLRRSTEDALYDYIGKRGNSGANVGIKIVRDTTTPQLWQKLRHQNVQQFYETFLTHGMRVYLTPYRYCTFMEMLERYTFLYDAKKYIFNIISGLEYLHQRQICNSRIAAHNIFISFRNSAVIGNMYGISKPGKSLCG